MQTRIQRWGNSLGLRIPKALAEDARVEEGSAVDISTRDGELIIRPIRPRGHDLRSLLSKITAKNIPDAIETGDPRGREIW